LGTFSLVEQTAASQGSQARRRRCRATREKREKIEPLVAALPVEDLDRLNGQFQARELQQKQALGETGDRIFEVHFPVDAVVSILTRMDDGPSVEIATIGNEGLVGLTVAWGGDEMNPREQATVQVAGNVVSMEADAFRTELQRQGALASLVQRYTLAYFSQVSQQVACNGLHSVEQRCARCC
jgi:hypothetical protein